MISTERAAAPPAPAGKKGKKGATPAAPSDPLLEVVLHDTVLFPEGGGQPSDVGILTVDGLELEVVEAKRRGGTAVHYVKAGSDGEGKLVPGASVTVELGEAGHKRRLDHVRSSRLSGSPLLL